jgi:hypothetical protein
LDRQADRGSKLTTSCCLLRRDDLLQVTSHGRDHRRTSSIE